MSLLVKIEGDPLNTGGGGLLVKIEGDPHNRRRRRRQFLFVV